MSKVTMPQPVGYLYQTGPFKIIDLKLFEDIPYNTTVKGVITTNQAEAYANARVREALEEAAEMADNVFSFSVGNTIRALIKG